MDRAYFLLHGKVKTYLKTVGQMAVRGDDDAALNVARVELPVIVRAFGALFDAHAPDDDGYCRECRTGRWFRRRRVPCKVFLRAQLALFPEPTDQPRHAA